MKDKGIQLNDSNDSGEVMDLKINPVRGEDGKIITGIVVGNTLEQNKAMILMAHPGDFKFNPFLGVGIEDALLTDDYLEFRHRIRKSFAEDGLKITRLDFYPGKEFKIDAKY